MCVCMCIGPPPALVPFPCLSSLGGQGLVPREPMYTYTYICLCVCACVSGLPQTGLTRNPSSVPLSVCRWARPRAAWTYVCIYIYMSVCVCMCIGVPPALVPFPCLSSADGQSLVPRGPMYTYTYICLCVCACVSGLPQLWFRSPVLCRWARPRTASTYVYIYIYMCVCMCVCIGATPALVPFPFVFCR